MFTVMRWQLVQCVENTRNGNGDIMELDEKIREMHSSMPEDQRVRTMQKHRNLLRNQFS